MSYIYPYIYIDYSGNLWRFFVNDNKELCYKVMYGEGKWTKNNIIDKDVLGFSVYINEDEEIHIIYNNNKGEIKYCTMAEKQWVGRVLLKNDENRVKIRDLEMIIIGSEMHIFYMQLDNIGNDHGILNHCIWNGREINNTLIWDVILLSDMEKYFSVSVNLDNTIDIFFISDDGDEISLNVCNYDGKAWSRAKRLYGINGREVNFEVINYEDQTHIINKSKEDFMYYLEYVSIKANNSIDQFKIFESSSKLSDVVIWIQDYKIYCSWLEEGKIKYSCFENKIWSKPNYADSIKGSIEKCKCFLWNKSENVIKKIEVYATNDIDIEIVIPNNLVLNNDERNYEINYIRENGFYDNENLEKLKSELSKVKIQKGKLEKRIDYLELQLKRNEKLINDYEERLNIILEQKHKEEENYNVFMELNQNIQKELSDVKKDLKDKIEINEKYKIEIEKINNELLEESEFNIEIKNQLNEVNTLLINEQNYKLILEKNLKDKELENNQLRTQIDNINIEMDRLVKELEIEKNQTIMERLLRKRSDGI